jgi:RNA polymerase sigma factor (sigma-70 family)
MKMTSESLSMTISSKQEFESLLQKHQKIVYKVVNTYCWQANDRADLAQEIAIQLWRSFHTYDSERSFSTWMYRIALNVAISNVRHQAKFSQLSVPLDESHMEIGNDDDDTGKDDERIKCLQSFVAQLDSLNRALMLLYLEDHAYREIADILGISETNVATKISRLKQRIRDHINTQS